MGAEVLFEGQHDRAFFVFKSLVNHSLRLDSKTCKVSSSHLVNDSLTGLCRFCHKRFTKSNKLDHILLFEQHNAMYYDVQLSWHILSGKCQTV